MAFLKHIGKHGDRKIVIIFRQLPGDEHMCLCIYPDLLPSHWHDTIMKVLESPVGQAAEEFADALHRNLLPDGRNILNALHVEKMMKRVNTEQVIITPNASSHVKLSELNNILNEMKKGEDAVRKMAEIDSARGLVDPRQKRAAEAQYKAEQQTARAPQPLVAASDGALDDKTLATNMLTQAVKMHNEATGMINEAARLRKEAEKLFPGVKMMDLPKMASVVTEETATPAPKKRGRKSAVAHATQ